MTLDLTPAALGLATLLFVLRVVNYSISTIRLVFIARSQRALAAALAFLEALIFAVTMASVVTDLSNLSNLLAYCLGAAVGSYVGMLLEARFVTSYRVVNVVAKERGKIIAEELRNAGYGVTLTHGEGRDGTVTMLRSIINNKDTSNVMEIVQRINPDAFVQMEQAQSIRRGWLHVPGTPYRRQ